MIAAERSDFERVVSHLEVREPFSRALANAALRQALTAARGSP
jgi:hypothetical protein